MNTTKSAGGAESRMSNATPYWLSGSIGREVEGGMNPKCRVKIKCVVIVGMWLH